MEEKFDLVRAVERSETDHGLIRVVDPYVRLSFCGAKGYGEEMRCL